MGERKRTSKDKWATKFKAKVEPMLSTMGGKILQEKFFTAIYTRNIPEINRYLGKGMDPNIRNSDYGVAPFHLLAERNDYELGYRLLQDTNINLELKTVYGEAAIHLAALCDCKQFIKMLLHNGANPNSRNRYEKTALHVAVERENYGIVMNLLKNGADVNGLDCFENTPLSLSIINVNNMLIAKTLFDYGVNMSTEHRRPLHIFFETVLNCRTISQIDFVVLLVDKGININMKEGSTGRNCLHFVAITGYLELAIILIQRGAKWDDVDDRQRTPSRAAIEHGNFMIADYLRKGYRPPDILQSLPLIYFWLSKVKARLAEKRAQEEQDEAIENK